MKKTFLFFVAWVLAAGAFAGEYNVVLNIGDAAPEWKSLPGVDGKEHSLGDLKEKKAVVVVFTCNSCPIATDYEDRIIALAKEQAKEVAFVAINVNKIPEDSLEEMKKRAESKQFPFPYLFDETQKIARDYGASWTPEFFVLDAERKIAYMGGMDNSSDPKAVTEKYLAPALAAVLKGETPEKAETPARGCAVRYARERRKR